MTISIIILAVVFILFNIVIKKQYGWLPSISNSYYMLKEDNLGGLFSLFMAYIGVELLLVAAFKENDTYVGFYFGAGAGAFFVGAATMYYKRITRTAHFGGAVMLILLSGVALWLVDGNIWPLVALGVGIPLALIKELKNPVYWYELWAFAWIMGGLILAEF